jgi:hypothetical protein
MRDYINDNWPTILGILLAGLIICYTHGRIETKKYYMYMQGYLDSQKWVICETNKKMNMPCPNYDYHDFYYKLQEELKERQKEKAQ